MGIHMIHPNYIWMKVYLSSTHDYRLISKIINHMAVIFQEVIQYLKYLIQYTANMSISD